MKPKGQSRLLATSAALIVATFAAPCAFAASDAWDGSTDATWATTTNWLTDPATVPGTGETATFNAASAFTSIDLGAGVTIGSIAFDGSAAAYTLGSGEVGSQSLTLDNAGSVNLTAAVLNSQLINAQLNLSTAANSTATLSNQSASLLTIAGNINAVPPAGNSLLTVSGAGNTTVTGAINETGEGGSALLKTGAGTLTLSNGGTYTGTGALGRVPATAVGFPLVAREGTLLLNGGTHTVTGELVIGGVVADGGPGQNAKLQLDAGSLAVSSWLSVGRGNGIGAVSSDFVLNNASTVTAANFSAGFNGGNGLNMPMGVITLNNTSAFSVNTNGSFQLAEGAGSNFTMTLNNSSSVTVNGAGSATNRYIGNTGATGVLTLNDSSSFAAGNSILNVGYQTGTGTLNIHGSSFTNTGEVRVGASNVNGAFTGGSGTVNISSGTVAVGALTLARGNDAAGAMNGTVNIGGTAVVTSEGDVTMGFNGTGCLGEIVVSGGTLNVATATKRWMLINRSGSANGQLDVDGGNVNLNTNTDIRFSTLAAGVGTNVVNLNGGAITSFSGNQTGDGAGVVDLQQGTGTASNNTFNLNGGTLAMREVLTAQNTNTAAFNFNGGTLKATGNTANFVNLGGANQTANILPGGAIIHSNGYDVEIPEALVSSGSDGGLTKQGAGNLTLGGANTYTGNTTVNAGTLTLADNATLRFAPQAPGVTNKITGPGTSVIQGDFTIDLTAATGGDGSTWTLVDTASNSFDPLTFAVTGFTEIGDTGVHQLVDGSKTWTFTESNAVLSLEVGDLSGFDLWITGFGLAAGDQAATADPDGDGFNNLFEYVLGGNPNSHDTSIRPLASKNGDDYVLVFKRSDLSEADTTLTVEYGDNLDLTGSYTVGASPGIAPVVIDENGSADDTVTVTIPTGGAARFFARLKVVR